VRVFDRTLATSADVLAHAITWAASHDARLINLSLGTSNPKRAAMLGAAVAEGMAMGALVVSARESGGVALLPGSLPNVAGVTLDPSCDRHELAVVPRDTPPGAGFASSGYPRPIEGVPVERNLSGISFAVANVTGFLARLLEAEGSARDVSAIVRRLLA